MSQSDVIAAETTSRGPLYSLYERYVGEPESELDVYGYTLFIVGYLIAFVGIVVFLTRAGTEPGAINQFAWRLSATLAAIGLPIALAGIVLLLPVRERALQATGVGVGMGMIGVIAFNIAFPENWFGRGADYTGIVIGIYAIGIAIVAGVALLVPIVTGKQGLLVEDELYRRGDQPGVMLGDEERGMLFSVFRTPEKTWTWWGIDQQAVASAVPPTSSRTEAKELVEVVKRKVGEAGLLEITTAAFRLYETGEGHWRWLLARDDGSAIAESAERTPDRDAAEESLSLLKEKGPDASIVEIDGAAFDYYQEDERWQWRLIDEDRSTLAVGPTDYDGREDVQAAADDFAARIGGARALTLESFGVELYEDADGWRWRILDSSTETVGTAVSAYSSRRAAEEAADAVVSGLESAPVIDRDSPGYEVHPVEGAWQWRLFDGDERIIIRGHARTDETSAQRQADRMAATVDTAPIVEMTTADYEIYPGDGGWNWRFVTADRTVVADRTDNYADVDAAREAIERVREQASEADLIEFDEAAFQQYQTDKGEWRWRLIDEGGEVMADSGTAYESKADVTDAMTTLKENAPNAKVLEIDTAAFELFRDGDDSWGWRLIDEGGRLIADDASRHDSRQEARDALSRLVEGSPDAEIREMAEPIFQVYTDEDAWQWRYVDTSNVILADASTSHGTVDDAEVAIEAVRGPAAGAPVHVIAQFAFAVENGDAVRWDLIDHEREIVVESDRIYPDRDAATEEIEYLREQSADLTLFTIGDAAIRLTESDDGWVWELIDAERTVYAQSPEAFADHDEALDVAERAAALGPVAETVEFEDATFDVVAEDDGWRWHLLDSDMKEIATGTTVYDNPDEARKAITDLRELVTEASILEIDDPAFELHRRNDGWIWQLVDENGDALAESIRTYETRAATRDAMYAIKEIAPGGTTTVAE